jgi:large subunit ribosomal protein L18
MKMATNNIHVVPYRRKRDGKTNYKKRLKLLLSNKTRLVIRKSLKNLLVQFVEYNNIGDKVTVSISSKVLQKNYGWNISKGNIPASYLTGLVAGIKAKKKGVKEVILDIGLQSSVHGTRIYAAVKGVIDAGISVACSKDMLPKDDVTSGSKIAKFSEHLKQKKPDKYNRQFSKYLKNRISPEKVQQLFADTKKKILSEG